MQRPRNSTQPIDQIAGWRVQQFVVDTEDATVANRRQILPLALLNDFLQRHAITRSAPGGNHDFGPRLSDRFERRGLTGLAEKSSARGFDQFRHPRLRSNQRLAPLFAEHQRTAVSRDRERANLFDSVLHALDNFLRLRARVEDPANHGDVAIDVVERSRRKPQKAHAGFEYFGHGFELIWHRGDDQIRLRRDDLLRLRRP